MSSIQKSTLVVLFNRLAAATALAQIPERAVERLEEFLKRFPDRGPGFAVVVVTPEKTLLKYTNGLRRASSSQRGRGRARTGSSADGVERGRGRARTGSSADGVERGRGRARTGSSADGVERGRGRARTGSGVFFG